MKLRSAATWVPRVRLLVKQAPPKRWCVSAVALACAVLGLSVIAGGYERHAPLLSPIDEGAHYDYVTHLLSGTLPQWGTKLDQDTLRMIDCESNSTDAEKCIPRHRTIATVENIGAFGFSYEAQQPPLGYLPFMLTASPNAPPGVALAHARRGGTVWALIAALLIVVYAAAESMSLLQLLVFLVLCLLCPSAVYAQATVTNDAGAVAAGLVALLAVRLTPRRAVGSAAAIGLVAGLAMGLVKGLCVLAPVALLIEAVIANRPWQASRAERSAMLKDNATIIALVCGSLVALFGWEIFQALRSTVSSAVVMNALLGFAKTQSLRSSTLEASIAQSFSLFDLGSLQLNPIWNIAVYGFVFSVAASRGVSLAWRNAQPLAVGVLIATVLLGVVWPVYNFIDGHFDVAAPARYALVLLPLLALVVVRANKRAALIWIGVLLPAIVLIAQLRTAGY